MSVPYTFATATGSIPLSQLDANFATGVTIGNTSVLLGGTITTINNLSLANVAITSVATQFPNGYLANSNVVLGTTTLTLGSNVTVVDGVTLSNVTISSGNVTISNVTVSNFSATTANVTGTANVSNLVVIGNATVGGNVSITGNVTGAKGTFTSANVSGTANVQIIAVTQDGTFGGNVSVAGNVSMTGIARNFYGDFSNATVISRNSFQTTTANSTTGIYALPSGTSTAASWQATNAADPTNASKILIATNGFTDVQLVSGRNGSGTYLPLSFYVSGAQWAQLDIAGSWNLSGAYTEGVVAIGNSSTSKTLSLATGTFQTVTMTGNCTFTMPTATAGKSFILIVNTGAGGFTGTFTSVKWPSNTAPTLTTTASRWDILTFFADGTNWYGTYAQAFQ